METGQVNNRAPVTVTPPPGSTAPQQPPVAPVQSPPASTPEESVAVTARNGSAAPTVSLVESEDVVAQGKEQFKEKFGLSARSYLPASSPRLAQTLAGYGQFLEQHPEIKEQIGGKNPRGQDFLYALEKAQKGQRLTRDDVESIQLFLVKDTRYGSELAYGTEEGVDGMYGFRSDHALDRFLNNFQPSDLIPDPYYQRMGIEP